MEVSVINAIHSVLFQNKLISISKVEITRLLINDLLIFCLSLDSINKKTIFAANSLNSNNNNNNNNRFLLHSLSPSQTTISSGLSINTNSRPILQKQTLPSSAVNNSLTQSQNMSQISQSLHNTTHTIFIKSAKQSLQNQLIPTMSSPNLLSKTEDYTS